MIPLKLIGTIAVSHPDGIAEYSVYLDENHNNVHRLIDPYDKCVYVSTCVNDCIDYVLSIGHKLV